MRYYFYHFLTWPQCSFVAETVGGTHPRIVGYVLGKMEEDADIPHGHITSISVLRSHRKLGIATRLLRQAHACMVEAHGARYVSLHVREGNRAARALYHDTLHYDVADVEEGYYADKENALSMRCPLAPDQLVFPLSQEELPPPFRVGGDGAGGGGPAEHKDKQQAPAKPEDLEARLQLAKEKKHGRRK
jgi:peptide alpha-N-acetyltransferase